MLVASSCPVPALGLFPLKHFKETSITPFHFAGGETEAQRSNLKQASGQKSLQSPGVCPVHWHKGVFPTPFPAVSPSARPALGGNRGEGLLGCADPRQGLGEQAGTLGAAGSRVWAEPCHELRKEQPTGSIQPQSRRSSSPGSSTHTCSPRPLHHNKAAPVPYSIPSSSPSPVPASAGFMNECPALVTAGPASPGWLAPGTEAQQDSAAIRSSTWWGRQNFGVHSPQPAEGTVLCSPPSPSLAPCPLAGDYFGLELVSCLCQVASWHGCTGNRS